MSVEQVVRTSNHEAMILDKDEERRLKKEERERYKFINSRDLSCKEELFLRRLPALMMNKEELYEMWTALGCPMKGVPSDTVELLFELHENNDFKIMEKMSG